jgi:hypothetical protein
VSGALQANILILKYEDLIKSPVREAEKISKYLRIQSSKEKLTLAVDRQSFENKKKAFLKNGQINKANFLRKGKINEWKHLLSKKHIRLVKNELSSLLDELGYQ